MIWRLDLTGLFDLMPVCPSLDSLQSLPICQSLNLAYPMQAPACGWSCGASNMQDHELPQLPYPRVRVNVCPTLKYWFLPLMVAVCTFAHFKLSSIRSL